MRKFLPFLDWRFLGLAALLCSPAAAGEPGELLAAARAGDETRLVELLESGVDVDVEDRYGSTALIVAASHGQREIVALLLERGANPSHRESFYGGTAVSMALFNKHPEVVPILLEAGADGRDEAFMTAVFTADVDLARVAVEAGPLLESTIEQLKAQPMLGAKFKDLVEKAESRPAPPAPDNDRSDLERFAGIFEGWDSDAETTVVLGEDGLLLMMPGEDPVALEVSGENEFHAEDGNLRVSFSGRAGTIEGVAVGKPGARPAYMRRSVARVVEGAGADLPRSLSAARRTVNWPSFRGVNADGIGDGEETPHEWDLEGGNGVLWQSDLPGLGNSSPIVWRDLVVVTTAVAEGTDQAIRTGLTGASDRVEEEVEHRWLVLAFDKQSGRELWATEVGRAVPLTQRHFKATQANSTPATDGRYIVAVFPTAGIVCLNMQGETLWHHELGGLNAGAFTDPGIEWGFASSPILYGSTVILQVDVHEGPYLAAWDLESGEQVWRTGRDVAPSWATPTVLAGPDGDELVVNGSTIRGYDPTTGEELWSLRPNSELVIATPVVGDGVAYVSAGYPPIKPIYALRAGTRGEVSAQPGREHERLVWSHSPGGAYMPTPLLYGGIFYVLHHNGRIVAYDASSGDAIYKRRFSRGGVFTGSPVAANGMLYLSTEEGMMYVLAAGPEFEELAINEFGEPLMATPAVSEGTIFVRTPSRLIALGASADGTPVSP